MLRPIPDPAEALPVFLCCCLEVGHQDGIRMPGIAQLVNEPLFIFFVDMEGSPSLSMLSSKRVDPSYTLLVPLLVACVL